MNPRVLQLAQILWPAFLVAGLIEMLVFAFIDPSQLTIGTWEPDRTTTYSLAFMTFWFMAALAAAASHWLMSQGPQQGRADSQKAAESGAHGRGHGRQRRARVRHA